MRRVWVVTLALALLAAPLAAEAQPTTVPRIGVLYATTVFGAEPVDQAFLRGLREHGYVPGQNLLIEARSADGKLDRLPELAAELVRLQVDLIVVPSPQAALAAKRVTTSIPILLVGASDPVGLGLVASLARPGGNVTGLTLMAPDLAGKRLDLLKDAVPHVSRVAVLRNPENLVMTVLWRETQAAATARRVEVQAFDARELGELDRALAAIAKARADALLVLPDALFSAQKARARIVDFVNENKLPTMHGPREEAEAGGLMAYGPSYTDLYQRAATYVDKILKGARPADLPVEQPTKFQLVINLKTAKALGLTIPPAVLARADEVIQ